MDTFETAKDYFLKGLAFQQKGLWDEAERMYSESLNLVPNRPSTLINLANAQYQLNKLDSARKIAEKAVEIDPDNPDALCQLGAILGARGSNKAAVEILDKCLNINPKLAEAYSNRGNALKDMKRLDEALASYEKAIALKPSIDFVLGHYCLLAQSLGDWAVFEKWAGTIIQKTEAGEKVCNPWAASLMFDNPRLLYQSAQIFSEKFSSSLFRREIDGGNKSEKIRVAYFSSDFNTTHPMSKCIRQVLRNHDRSAYEIYGFTYGRRMSSPDEVITQNLDHHYDIHALRTKEVTQIVSKLGIDIAVDLNGYTKDSRSELFASRLAPIQVSFLGYPGTMGCDFMDYIIADRFVVPEKNRKFFSEKIVYLPHSYFPYSNDVEISSESKSRAYHGLPGGAFVFCCFNGLQKITGDTFHLWMRILNSVDDSVLWLLADNQTAMNNLKREAERRGIQSSRLIFAPRISNPEHLSRHRLADLFLDTIPYNAHTGACEALWTGLPIITLTGKSFTGCVATSILNAIGLPDLVTSSKEKYFDLAVFLARNEDQLVMLKARLSENRISKPLFDNLKFARGMEAAFRKLVERQRAGLSPDHIYVSEHDLKPV